MNNVVFQNDANSCGLKSRTVLLFFLLIFSHLLANAQLKLALDDNNAPYFVCDSIVKSGVTYKFHSTSLNVKYNNAEKPYEIILYGGYFDIIRYDENLASDVTLFGSLTITNTPSKPDECFISCSLPVRFSDEAASNSVNQIICPVKNIPYRLFKGKEKLKKVDAYNKIKIQSLTQFFYGCTNLSSVDLKNFDTSEVKNMSTLFFHCSSLTALDLSNFDTSNVTSMYCMFDGCESLTALDLSNFDTSNVTDMRSMFSGCHSLTALDVSNFDTRNVTSMYRMFDGCHSLTALDLSNFDTSNVTSMYCMFCGCESLTALDLSNFDTRNVTDMSVMFPYCRSLTALDLSNFNTSNVTSMYRMFDGCQSLTALDVSNFNTSNVTSMRYMFSGCRSLTALDLSNFDTSNVTIMSSMFYDCRSLTALDLSNFNTSNVTSMSSMFSGCQGLTALDLSNFNTSNVMSMSSMFSGCQGLTALDLSNFNTSNVTSMSSMFSGCQGLTALDLSNFNTSNVTRMDWMFDGCRSLTALDLGNFDTRDVTSMGGMFDGCQSLTALDVSNFNTSNVTSMDRMFYGCQSLTALDLSNFNTSNVTSMFRMFYSCQSLTALDVSNFNTSNVPDMEHMFYDCRSLTALDVSNFNTSNVTNMCYMFYDCRSLTALDLSNFNTSNVTDMEAMFYGCQSLKNLSLGSGFNISKSFSSFYSAVSNLRIYVDAEAKPGVDESLKMLGFAEKNGYTTSTDTINAVITNGEIYWATYYNSVASVTLPNDVDAYTAKVEDGRMVLKGIEGRVVPKGNAVILKGKMAEMVLDVNTKPKTKLHEDNELNGVDVESLTQEHTYVLSVNEERVGMLDDEYDKIAAHKAYMQRTAKGEPKFFPFVGEETEHYINLSATDSPYEKLKRNQMVLGYYTSDKISEDGYGGRNAGLYKVCIGFSREQMTPFAGNRITNVRFALKDTDITDLKLWIGSTRDKNDLCSQSVASLKEGWNEVTLNSPCEITGDSIFIGIEYEQSGGRWPISVVSEGAELGSSYFYGPYNGVDVESIWLPADDESLSIQCVVEGDRIPQYDLHACGLTFSTKYVKASSTKHIQANSTKYVQENNYYYAYLYLRNWGKKDVSSATIACEIDGVEIATSALSTGSRSIGGNYISFKIGDITPGKHKLTLRVKDINGAVPEFPSDDAQSVNIKSYSQDMGRDKVMLELYTGTWCPNTPRAHKQIAALMEERDDIVLVSNHLLDVMSCDASEAYGVFTNHTPTTFYDRYASYGSKSLGSISIDGAKAEPSLAKLNISAEYNETNRQLAIKVNGIKNDEFDSVEEYAYLTVLLTEDSITYTQRKYEEGNYIDIDDYVHNGVLRTNVSEIWGDPVTWTGKEFEKTYTIRLNDEWVKDNMHVVAFLAKPFTGSNYEEIGLVNCNELLLRNAKVTDELVNPGSGGLKGDVNGDGVVDLADISIIITAIVGDKDKKADVNEDGIVNVADIVTVLTIMAL